MERLKTMAILALLAALAGSVWLRVSGGNPIGRILGSHSAAAFATCCTDIGEAMLAVDSHLDRAYARHYQKAKR